QAQELDVSVKLLPLLHKSVEINSLNLQRPSVELIKNAQGVWNFSTLGANPQAAPPQPGQTQPSRPAPQSKPAPSTTGPKPGPTESKQQFSLGELAITDGVLSGHTNIANENGKLAAAGQMSVDKPRVHGLDVGYPISADYDINDDLTSDLVKVNKAVVKLGQTPLSATGTVNMKPTPMLLDLHLIASDVSIAEAARLASAAGIAFAPGTTVNGRVNADITARGPADKPALNGTVAGREIQVTGKEIAQ